MQISGCGERVQPTSSSARFVWPVWLHVCFSIHGSISSAARRSAFGIWSGLKYHHDIGGLAAVQLFLRETLHVFHPRNWIHFAQSNHGKQSLPCTRRTNAYEPFLGEIARYIVCLQVAVWWPPSGKFESPRMIRNYGQSPPCHTMRTGTETHPAIIRSDQEVTTNRYTGLPNDRKIACLGALTLAAVCTIWIQHGKSSTRCTAVSPSRHLRKTGGRLDRKVVDSAGEVTLHGHRVRLEGKSYYWLPTVWHQFHSMGGSHHPSYGGVKHASLQLISEYVRIGG